jgi:uncharacterized membrane protein
MDPKKGKPPSPSGRLVGRLRWLNLRRATLWVITRVVASRLQLLAAAAHTTAAVAQRVATAVMQPLVASQKVTAVQVTTMGYIHASLIYALLFGAAGRYLRQEKLHGAQVATKHRDRVFKAMLRLTKNHLRIHTFLSRLKEWEGRNRWVMTVATFLTGWLGTNLMSQLYAKKIPFSAGNSIVTMGPLVLGVVIAWKEREEKGRLPIFFPLMSAVGLAMMVPWGTHLDHGAVLAATFGAIFSATAVSAGKDIAKAGVSLKVQVITMGVGILLGSWSLLSVTLTSGILIRLSVTPTPEILIRGAIAGLLTVIGAVLYWISQGPLDLPKRGAAALSANSPALTSLIGWGVLRQAIDPRTWVGIGTILVSSLLNAGLTGPKAKKAAAMLRTRNIVERQDR